MADITRRTKRYPSDLTDEECERIAPLVLDREAAGREASPSGGVIDSQSIKAPHAKTRGYDAGEKIVGRKRHIAVDTDDRLLLAAG